MQASFLQTDDNEIDYDEDIMAIWHHTTRGVELADKVWLSHRNTWSVSLDCGDAMDSTSIGLVQYLNV